MVTLHAIWKDKTQAIARLPLRSASLAGGEHVKCSADG